tara:strand:+ start:256 stop:540 length:285 start_codon:yes stop_codon:yes gene_type:complete
MPDIDDIWDDQEDMAMYGAPPISRDPRLCRDIFDSNAEGFIGELTAKIARFKAMRSNTSEGGDYRHTLDRYIGMLVSARIAATAHRDITLRDHT